jgi:hypothetical protein
MAKATSSVEVSRDHCSTVPKRRERDSLRGALRASVAHSSLTERPSGRLPEFDPVAFRISDPAESTDTVHSLRLVGHVRILGA